MKYLLSLYFVYLFLNVSFVQAQDEEIEEIPQDFISESLDADSKIFSYEADLTKNAKNLEIFQKFPSRGNKGIKHILSSEFKVKTVPSKKISVQIFLSAWDTIAKNWQIRPQDFVEFHFDLTQGSISVVEMGKILLEKKITENAFQEPKKGLFDPVQFKNYDAVRFSIEYFLSVYCRAFAVETGGAIREDFTFNNGSYNYEIKIDLMNPQQKNLLISMHKKNEEDAAGYIQVYNSKISVIDQIETNKRMKVRIYYAKANPNANYAWTSMANNYVDAFFDFNKGRIRYVPKGDKMLFPPDKLNKNTKTSFEIASFASDDAITVAINFFIMHYYPLFMQK